MQNLGNSSMNSEKSCPREGIARALAGQGNDSIWGEEVMDERSRLV